MIHNIKRSCSLSIPLHIPIYIALVPHRDGNSNMNCWGMPQPFHSNPTIIIIISKSFVFSHKWLQLQFLFRCTRYYHPIRHSILLVLTINYASASFNGDMFSTGHSPDPLWQRTALWQPAVHYSVIMISISRMRWLGSCAAEADLTATSWQMLLHCVVGVFSFHYWSAFISRKSPFCTSPTHTPSFSSFVKSSARPFIHSSLLLKCAQYQQLSLWSAGFVHLKCVYVIRPKEDGHRLLLLSGAIVSSSREAHYTVSFDDDEEQEYLNRVVVLLCCWRDSPSSEGASAVQ